LPPVGFGTLFRTIEELYSQKVPIRHLPLRVNERFHPGGCQPAIASFALRSNPHRPSLHCLLERSPRDPVITDKSYQLLDVAVRVVPLL